jgi:hypothetical protein
MHRKYIFGHHEADDVHLQRAMPPGMLQQMQRQMRGGGGMQEMMKAMMQGQGGDAADVEEMQRAFPCFNRRLFLDISRQA